VGRSLFRAGRGPALTKRTGETKRSHCWGKKARSVSVSPALVPTARTRPISGSPALKRRGRGAASSCYSSVGQNGVACQLTAHPSSAEGH
jgi:hypothetical protein